MFALIAGMPAVPAVPLLHGSMGWLDEAIATGMMLAAALAVVIIYRMPRAPQDDPAVSQSPVNGNSLPDSGADEPPVYPPQSGE